MPIYEYQCQSCQHRLERLQKISDSPLVDCPACGKPALQKQISAAAFKLKGSGWYETDFKNKGNQADSSNATAKPAKDTASSGSGSDSASPASAKAADAK